VFLGEEGGIRRLDRILGDLEMVDMVDDGPFEIEARAEGHGRRHLTQPDHIGALARPDDEIAAAGEHQHQQQRHGGDDKEQARLGARSVEEREGHRSLHQR